VATRDINPSVATSSFIEEEIKSRATKFKTATMSSNSSSRSSSSSIINDERLPLSKLNVLITGASSGIGKATSILLSKEGATIIGVGRNEDSLKELKSNNDIYDYIIIDLLVEKKKEKNVSKYIIDQAVSLLAQGGKGELTTLINNAGVLKTGAAGSFIHNTHTDTNTNTTTTTTTTTSDNSSIINSDDNDDDDDEMISNYHDSMTMNTQIPYELMNYATPYLEKASSSLSSLSSIVNVSSVNGKQSFKGCIAYCMSKAALDMMTKCASVDLAPKGIRVNSVNPGVIKTPIHTRDRDGMNQDQYDSFMKRCIEVTHPIAQSLGRCGTTEEVAELICFLVSDKAKFLTGECIAIDGGRQNLGSR